ncbi:MAG: hypothetical protein ACE5NA_04650 [Nitrospiraceae bacterium]
MHPILRTLSVIAAVTVAAGIVITWQDDAGRPLPQAQSQIGITPAKSIGTSALSHGGPVSTRDKDAVPDMTQAQIGIGQLMIVSQNKTADSVLQQEVPLLSSPDATPSGSGSPTVTAGTEVRVTSAARTSTAGVTRQYYLVQLPDGRTGWLPQDSLRARSRELPASQIAYPDR